MRKLCVTDHVPVTVPMTPNPHDAPEEERSSRQLGHLRARRRAGAAFHAKRDNRPCERLIQRDLEPVIPPLLRAALHPGVIHDGAGRVDEVARPPTGETGTGVSITTGTTMSNLATLE